MLPAALTERAAQVLRHAEDRRERIATAESCTGGLVAAALTAIAGSSSVMDRGFVTYSNEAKTEMLGVPPQLIASCGAVSREVALAMAEGALAHSRADAAVAVTGIAGPGGGSADKPVGLVHFALARRGEATRHAEHRFEGDRDGIRLQAALTALGLFLPPQPT
ncbi:damage-inducible protein CinA [Magnetospirillum sp. ME-1]|uniref:CinA family protein n=1 Tax=Magnetospirillum sp. ME-1 TaxID=1639348 RepID=UPI000A17F5CC|nr:CinA family protein [Magnetospirillum sp. ME-1]ARJ65368.1 damage-inducible protein CinA [Magnetospirillum sp. ME-1]